MAIELNTNKTKNIVNTNTTSTTEFVAATKVNFKKFPITPDQIAKLVKISKDIQTAIDTNNVAELTKIANLTKRYNISEFYNQTYKYGNAPEKQVFINGKTDKTCTKSDLENFALSDITLILDQHLEADKVGMGSARTVLENINSQIITAKKMIAPSPTITANEMKEVLVILVDATNAANLKTVVSTPDKKFTAGKFEGTLTELIDKAETLLGPTNPELIALKVKIAGLKGNYLPLSHDEQIKNTEIFNTVSRIMTKANIGVLNDPTQGIDPKNVVLYFGTDEEVSNFYTYRTGMEIGKNEDGVLKRPLYLRVPNGMDFDTISAALQIVGAAYSSNMRLENTRIESHGTSGAIIADGSGKGGYVLFEEFFKGKDLKKNNLQPAPFFLLAEHLKVAGCQILWDAQKNQIDYIKAVATKANVTMDLNATIGFMNWPKGASNEGVSCAGRPTKRDEEDFGPGGNAVRFAPNQDPQWITRRGDDFSAIDNRNGDCNIAPHIRALNAEIPNNRKTIDELNIKQYEVVPTRVVGNTAVRY